MASILDTPFKEITSEQLESLNFTREAWGNPDRIIYPEKPSSYRDGLRDRVCVWNDDKYFWEYIDYNSDNAKIFVGVINYYPDTFNAYVAEFQYRGGCGKSKHPAGYVFLYITDPYLPVTDIWKDVIKINSMEDINLAIATLENKIKEFRNK